MKFRFSKLTTSIAITLCSIYFNHAYATSNDCFYFNNVESIVENNNTEASMARNLHNFEDFESALKTGKLDLNLETAARFKFSGFFKKVRMGKVAGIAGGVCGTAEMMAMDIYSFIEAIKSDDVGEVAWSGSMLITDTVTSLAGLVVSEAASPFLAAPAFALQVAKGTYDIAKDAIALNESKSNADRMIGNLKIAINRFETLGESMKGRAGIVQRVILALLDDIEHFGALFMHTNSNIATLYAAKQLVLYSNEYKMDLSDIREVMKSQLAGNSILLSLLDDEASSMAHPISTTELSEALQALKPDTIHYGTYLKASWPALDGYYKKVHSLLLPFIEDMTKKTFRDYTEKNIIAALRDAYHAQLNDPDWKRNTVQDYNKQLYTKIAWMYFADYAVEAALKKAADNEVRAEVEGIAAAIFLSPWLSAASLQLGMHIIQNGLETDIALIDGIVAGANVLMAALIEHNISITDHDYFEKLLEAKKYTGTNNEGKEFVEEFIMRMGPNFSDVFEPARAKALAMVESHKISENDLIDFNLNGYQEEATDKIIIRNREKMIRDAMTEFDIVDPLKKLKDLYSSPNGLMPGERITYTYMMSATKSDYMYYGKMLEIIKNLEDDIASNPDNINGALRTARHSLALLQIDLDDKLSPDGLAFVTMPFSSEFKRLLMRLLVQAEQPEIDQTVKPLRCINFENDDMWALSEDTSSFRSMQIKLTYQLTTVDEVSFDGGANTFELVSESNPDLYIDTTVKMAPVGVKKRDDTFTFDLLVNTNEPLGKLKFRPVTDHGNNNTLFTLIGGCQSYHFSY